MSYTTVEGQKVNGEWCAFTTSRLVKSFEIDLPVQVHYGELTARQRLVAVSRNDPTVLVLDRLQSLKLDWYQICLISYQQPTGPQPLLGCFNGIFKEKVGTVSIHKARLHVRSNTASKAFKSLSVLFSTKEAKLPTFT